MKDRSSSGWFRALDHANYRLFFGGQGISVLGTWMQTMAMSWLVYRLTGSTFLLGAIAFANQIPSFVLAPFTGVVADRFHRHKMLILTQVLSMVQAALLAFLTLEGKVEVWHLFVFSGLLGTINAFDMPIRQSFVIDMLERREDLGNAIAMNSMLINSGRLIGPPVAGLMINWAGEGACFLMNALSFTAVIGALLAMRLPAQQPREKRGSVLGELREGVGYAFGFPAIRYPVMLLGMMSVTAFSYTVLMPPIAAELLGGKADTMGFLMGAIGMGALGGAWYMASRQGPVGLEKKIPQAVLVMGISLIAFSFSRQVGLSMLLLVPTGFGMIVEIVSSNTLLQTVVEDDKRGRVMSLYSMSLMGMSPFGVLLAGWMAEYWGAAVTVMICGVWAIIGAIGYWSRMEQIVASTEPVYRNLYGPPESE